MRTQAKPLDIGGGRAMRLGWAVKALALLRLRDQLAGRTDGGA